MDLKEEFPDLSSFLLYADGLKPLFFIIVEACKRGPPKLKDVASKALEQVKKIHATGVRSSDPSYLDALLPVLLEALDTENIKDQSNALWALGILVKHGYINRTPSSLVKFFKTDNDDLLYKAAWVVQKYSHQGMDISQYIPHLEPLLEYHDYWTRRRVANAISEHEIRIGKEERLVVSQSLYDCEKLDSYWQVYTYHRRLHALTDTPLKESKSTAHIRLERMCGACGFSKAQCIFYWDDSGTGWIDRTSEYLCPECGRYTAYHYVD